MGFYPTSIYFTQHPYVGLPSLLHLEIKDKMFQQIQKNSVLKIYKRNFTSFFALQVEYNKTFENYKFKHHSLMKYMKFQNNILMPDEFKDTNITFHQIHVSRNTSPSLGYKETTTISPMDSKGPLSSITN